MFNNIGEKIKGLAVGMFVIQAVAAFFWAAHIIVEQEMFLLAFLVFIGGLALAWISVCFIYGFGELIDRTTSIDEKLSNLEMDSDPSIVSNNKMN